MQRTLTLSTLTLFTAFASTAWAEQLSVPGTYPDIQAAIDAAVDGDEILIAAGTYDAVATLDNLGKAIILSGATDANGSPTTILVGPGRVLYCTNSGTGMTVFRNLVIQNGTTGQGASERGGGLKIDNGNAALFNCTFLNNSSNWSGGGAVYVFHSSAMFGGCHFQDNEALYGDGGAVQVGSESQASFTTCTFHSNTGRVGGAVSAGASNSDGYLTMSDCEFWNNLTNWGSGGALYLTGDATLESCVFDYNEATGMGGGIYARFADELILRDCVFNLNFSFAVGGGGLYVQESNPVLENCTFQNNWSFPDGGGIYSQASSPTLTNCVFTKNYAASQGKGGGMYFEASSPQLIDCLFVENTALLQGGGIDSVNSNVEVINSEFIGNESNYGGAVHNTDGILELTSNTFVANVSGSSGGSAIDGSGTSTITDCTISENQSASTSGGAVRWWSGYTTMSNCSFSRNSGTGLAVVSSTYVLDSCMFCENSPQHVYASNATYIDNGGNEFFDVCPTGCPGDLDDDGVVGGADMGLLLAAWQTSDANADINDDGVVNGGDLGILLAAWGNCS